MTISSHNLKSTQKKKKFAENTCYNKTGENMKKRLILGLVGILILITIICMTPLKDKKIQDFFLKYNDFFYDTISSIHEFPDLKSGNLTANLYYQGAHKEPYKTTQQYTFFKKEEQIYLKNESGYTNIRQKTLLEIMNKWKKIEKEEKILEIIHFSSKKNSIDLDTEKINNTLHTNFQNTHGIIKTKGLWKKITEIELYFDDITVILKENNILIKKENNTLNISLTTNGYALNYNNQIKIQKEKTVEADNYHINIANNTFYLCKKEQELIFRSNIPKESFHSLELIFEKNEVDESITKKMSTEIPFLKYLKSLNLIGDN